MISYLHVFSPIIGLGINVISQVCCCHIRGFSLLRSIFVGFALGIFSLLFIEFLFLKQPPLLSSGNISSIFVSTVTYSALGYGYFHFINLGETARRIRILTELMNSQGGLSLNEILRRYNAKEIVERRLLRLIKTGQIVFKNDKYYIGRPMMLLIARFLATLKFILLGKKM